jgi:hypothetical protein
MGSAMLVVDDHHHDHLVDDPVADGVRKAHGGDVPLECLSVWILDRGRAGVGPPSHEVQCASNGGEEAIAQALLSGLVPQPCVDEVVFGERMELDGQGSL